MITKALHRFTSRVAHYDADLELVDVFIQSVHKNELTPQDGKLILRHVNPDKHKTLAKRTPSSGGRAAAVSHLRRNVYGSYIKDLFEEVELYLIDLLVAVTATDIAPDRLVGQHKVTLDINEILKCGSWDGLIHLLSKELFRKIQNTQKSTLYVLESIDSKLNLGADEVVRREAMPYLELRHLLVHADGKADKNFCTTYPEMGATEDESIKLTFEVVSAARTKVVALIENYDKCVIEKLSLPDKFIHLKK
ncbi:hypothetical protein EJV47_23780 [Hymenobacter gummosus]|uniref:RiboL-PSP-HEPN domain-containing protein n=1 Tax=Hymenobacter gummosus TaxID=1776032 RepID=A0A431TWD8_9BACT|nr:hypothetical protein [Hymenobacter gummosus]RTQ45853.1 hypothetical protein EJV47_23780 [Hymenobacter gummosus]